jgi:putative phage-type endonuclease
MLINLEQRTPEWLAWRLGGCAASSIAALLDCHPYTTKLELFEEISGRMLPKEISSFMKKGIAHENEAREMVNTLLGTNFVPACVQADHNTLLRASLDGIHGDTVLELKVPTSDKLLKCVEKQDLELFKKTHPHYWWQVQAQLLSSGCKKAIFAVYWLPTPLEDPRVVMLDIEANIADFELIENAVNDFWTTHIIPDLPPIDNDRMVFVDDPELLSLSESWIHVNAELKLLESREKELRSAMLEKGDDGSFCNTLLKFTRTSRVTIDYKKACEDNGIDLVKYKKEAIGSYRIAKI